MNFSMENKVSLPAPGKFFKNKVLTSLKIYGRIYTDKEK